MYTEKRKATNRTFTGSSYSDIELKKNKNLELSYIIAPPRMAYYMKYSSKIYKIYLKYFSSEDIYVYSIDEVFIDVTHYLKTYNMGAKRVSNKSNARCLSNNRNNSNCRNWN